MTRACPAQRDPGPGFPRDRPPLASSSSPKVTGKDRHLGGQSNPIASQPIQQSLITVVVVAGVVAGSRTRGHAHPRTWYVDFHFAVDVYGGAAAASCRRRSNCFCHCLLACCCGLPLRRTALVVALFPAHTTLVHTLHPLITHHYSHPPPIAPARTRDARRSVCPSASETETEVSAV